MKNGLNVRKSLIGAGLALVLAGQMACSSPSGESGEKSAGAQSSDIIPVSVMPVQTGDFDEVVEATGRVEPIHRAILSAQVSGRIVKSYVELGDFVKKDSPLLLIDPATYQLALDQAEAQVLAAKAAYDKAQADFARNQKLHKTGDISDYIFENSRLQLASADAALQQARAARDLARKRLDDATLRAPFDGQIAAKQFDLGNTAAPGVPVVTLVDIRRLKVKIGVSEQDVVRLRKNQPASLQIDAYPGHTFQGRISAIAPDADMRTRTFPVEIVLTNPAEYPLRAGMVAKVRVQLSQIKGVPMIPTSALVQSAQTRVAFVVRNGKAEKRTLKLGPQKGNRIAVLQGLQPGEKVIVLGQDRVSDGSQVKIVQENKLLPQ